MATRAQPQRLRLRFERGEGGCNPKGYPLAELAALLGEIGARVAGISSHLIQLPPKWNKGRTIRQAEMLRWLEISG